MIGTTTMDGNIIGHHVIGHGPVKVMVFHAWFGDHTIWEPAFRFIDRSRFSFAFLDYRGYGASRDMGGEHSYRQISSDAIALADHLQWPTFSVLGHSMGGQAAQRVALDAPSRVQAIVGVTPAPATGMKMPPEVAAFFGTVADSDEAGLQIIETSIGKRLKPGMSKDIMRFTRETTSIDAFRDYGGAFITTDFGEEAKAITAPMLILVGEHDGGVTEVFVRSTFPGLYPHVEIEVLPNAGHYPMLETPAWLMTRVEHFLSQRVV